MRKFVFNIFIIVLCLFCINTVDADSIAFKNVKFDENEVSVDIEVSTTTKLAGGMFEIKYDSTKIKEPQSSSKLDKYDVDIAQYLLFSGDYELNGTNVVGTLTFKIDESFKIGEETTITLEKGSFASNDLREWDVEGTSITIKREEIKQNDSGNNNANDENNTTPDGESSSNGGDNNEDGNPLYSCQKNDGKFYNKNGVEVSKVQYEKECAIVNPDTGFNFPAVMFVGGLIAMVFIFIKNRNSIKLNKI